VSCADASFAANAIAPKSVAEAVMKRSARCVAVGIKVREPNMQENDLTYRSARPEDDHSIVEFQIAMAHETEEVTLDPKVCTRGVRAVFADPSLGRYFVAESAGRVVASLMLTYEWSDWRAGMVWWIQSVYVIPELRGRRVYAGLYEHVKALAERDESIRGIRLYVDRRNTRAQQVYTRLGMNGEHYQVFEWMK
jgi:GNAT superfamily N-acetyltransferase